MWNTVQDSVLDNNCVLMENSSNVIEVVSYTNCSSLHRTRQLQV